MVFNDIMLDSQIDVFFIHHHRSFLLQQMGPNTETNIQTSCIETATMEYTALSEMSPKIPPLRAQRIPK